MKIKRITKIKFLTFMKKYIFSKFSLTNSYKKELIEFVKNMCNAEIGGNKFYDGSGTHYMQNPKEIVDLVFALKKYEKKSKKKLSSFLEIGFATGVNNTFLNKLRLSNVSLRGVICSFYPFAGIIRIRLFGSQNCFASQTN